MRRNNRKKSGITLIEAVVSAAIAAVIFVAVSRMLVTAMQMSRTGSSHLTNLLAADIVLQQILLDLKQATAIVSDDTQLAAGNLDLEKHYWEDDSANPGLSAVSYRLPEDGRGLMRSSEGNDHRYYPDRSIKMTFKRVKVEPNNALGLIIELKISTPPDETEQHSFKRFVYLESLPENRGLINDYQPVQN
mgnify:CR=1 FL=1|jgi:type II secretory pathway pseudopilin PulG